MTTPEPERERRSQRWLFAAWALMLVMAGILVWRRSAQQARYKACPHDGYTLCHAEPNADLTTAIWILLGALVLSMLVHLISRRAGAITAIGALTVYLLFSATVWPDVDDEAQFWSAEDPIAFPHYVVFDAATQDSFGFPRPKGQPSLNEYTLSVPQASAGRCETEDFVVTFEDYNGEPLTASLQDLLAGTEITFDTSPHGKLATLGVTVTAPDGIDRPCSPTLTFKIEAGAGEISATAASEGDSES